ncbi:hypothetical protein BC937DRAFT_95255 [Endogone sp. FLAS-F59071]|nr:hypothetical protein BC937DRAFT_95255 [Endogone sp. FLAS-F59071]|eukprot:RUS20429.1 hypothetical protein BC937DRAFT_95255 [Endogone sp. FLAS-F59071]
MTKLTTPFHWFSCQNLTPILIVPQSLLAKSAWKWTRLEVIEFFKANQNVADFDQEDIDLIAKKKYNGQTLLKLTEARLVKSGLEAGVIDMVMELVEKLKKLRGIVSTTKAVGRDLTYERIRKLPSPSSMANPQDFNEMQIGDPVILCSRPPDAVGLPVALLDPILAKFQADADALNGVEPDKDDISFILDLSCDMCSLTFSNEDARRDTFIEHLNKYLQKRLLYSFGNQRVTDGSLMFIKNNYEIPLLSVEMKPEFGIGKGCAYMQSCLYYLKFITKLEDKLVPKQRFPVFLMYLAGPYLGIAAAVFQDKPVVEPITQVMPLFCLPHNESMMLQNARIFKALKIALADLEELYGKLTEQPQPNIDSDLQWNFPYVDSVEIKDSKRKLKYIKKLGGRYVFQATMEGTSGNPEDVVVKFAKRYSKACHKACYKSGIAPKLYAFKWINGGWCVIVMALLKDHETSYRLAQDSKLSQSIKTQAENAVKKMHDNGFVHGDLRLPNIMVGPNDSIQIIDFDWAGKTGETVYPYFLNPEVDWHEEVNAAVEIKPEHDIHMLKIDFMYRPTVT